MMMKIKYFVSTARKGEKKDDLKNKYRMDCGNSQVSTFCS